MDKLIDLQFRQISCQRSVSGDSFAQGVQDYNFSIGRPYGLVLNKCYYRIAVEITGLGGLQPQVSEQLAFADSVAGNLYNNIYLRAGGQDVSSLLNYVGQAQQIKNRLKQSGAWLNSIGKDSYGCEADFQTRINNVALSSSKNNVEEKTQRIGLGTSAGRTTATIAIDTDGTVTGVNTLLSTGDSTMIIGDKMVVNGVVYKASAAATDDLGASLVLTPFPTTAVVASANAYKIKPEASGDGRNIVYVMWQPPIGIFDEESPLGSGDYTLQLNPNSNYKSSCVQGSNLTGAVYDFNVLDVQLYIATVIVDAQTTGTDTLHLMEMQLQSKKISSGENTLDFTVPPSTKAISVFVQSGDAGSNIAIPPSVFKTKDRSDEGLQSIQLTYANSSKPATRWTSEFSSTKNYLQQRYNDTQLYSGRFFDAGGAETFPQWLKRGPLYHYTFIRDIDNPATQLQISAQFGTLELNTNLIVCAHYSKVVQISTQNGFVIEVKSLAT